MERCVWVTSGSGLKVIDIASSKWAVSALDGELDEDGAVLSGNEGLNPRQFAVYPAHKAVKIHGLLSVVLYVL